MIWATLTIALLIVALLLGDLAFSKLTINMSIPADPITKEAVVTIQKDHPNPDFENGIIGGTQIDKEVSIDGTYSATGSKETGNPAKGNLTIQNELGTDVAVGAGATVRSGGGVSFKTDAAVTVPKATLDAGGNKVLGRTTIAVTAAQPGGTSNLPANTSYVVEGKTGISLTGATSGGTSQKVKIVNQSDIDSAKKDLAAKAVERFKTETKADADIVLLDEAFTSEASSFTTTKNANDQVDNFNATAKVRVVTMTFSKKDFNKAVQTIASKDVPDGKSLLVTEQDQVEQTLQDKQLNVGQLKVKGTLNSHIGPKVDLEKLIAGFRVKPIKKIRQEVEAIPEARVGDIILSPSFALPFGPLIKKNTQIKIEYTNK